MGATRVVFPSEEALGEAGPHDMPSQSGATQARSSTTQAVAPSWTLPRPDDREQADVRARASRDGAKKLHISNKHKLVGPPVHEFNARPCT